MTVSSSTFKNKIHSTGSIGYNYDTLAGGGVTVGYSETDSGKGFIDAINGQASWNANYGFQGSADLSFNPERLGQVAKDSWDYLKQVGKGFTDSMGNAMDDLMNGVGYVFRGRDDEEGSLMQDLFGHTDEYKFKKYWASLSKEEKFNMLAGRFDRKDRQVKPKRYSTDQDNSEIIDPEKFGSLEYLLKYPRKSTDADILNRKAVLEKAREKLSDKDLDDFYKNNKPKIIEISEKYGEEGVNDFLKGALLGTTGTIAETILSPLEMVSSDMKKKPLSESEKMKATKEFFEGKSDAFIEGYLRANNITEKAIIVGGIYSLAKSVAKSTLASRNSVQTIIVTNKGVSLTPELLSKRGTSPRVGEFTALRGARVEDVFSRVPSNWKVSQQKDGAGFRFFDNLGYERLRIHGPDDKAPVGSNSHSGWTIRVSDRDGNYYDEFGRKVGRRANEGHIPIYGNPVLNPR